MPRWFSIYHYIPFEFSCCRFILLNFQQKYRGNIHGKVMDFHREKHCHHQNDNTHSVRYYFDGMLMIKTIWFFLQIPKKYRKLKNIKTKFPSKVRGVETGRKFRGSHGEGYSLGVPGFSLPEITEIISQPMFPGRIMSNHPPGPTLKNIASGKRLHTHGKTTMLLTNGYFNG